MNNYITTRETVCGAWAIKALQVKEAGEQERALTQYLMGVILFIQSHIKLQEVKQLKETAVCESMHGGVRGRGVIPLPTRFPQKSLNRMLKIF
ncbi:MAG: hypothetical protein IPH58_11450 [Sphingobacteriales bacterium]|nr:hypothetical protein [Sphingobacteriales bacterium]